MSKSCVIIGGGIGGLFTGAFLSKNGYKVTVLEKNPIIGGGLQCFYRNGKIYETGMHVAGGFEPGGNLYKICRYLGIYDRLDIQHIPARCMDELYYHSTGEVFKISSGKEHFAESLIRYFPHQRQGILDYVDEIFRITEEVPLFQLKAASGTPIIYSPNFTIAADKLIAKFVTDGKLREILAYLNPLYGGVAGHTPAYVHALINVLYIKGASRFVGGSQQLASALQSVITDNGGQVLTNQEVTEINVTDKAVTRVVTKQGVEYHANHYVSAIHPTELIRLCSAGSFLHGFVKRLNEIPNSYSAFSLYIDLKDNSIPYIDHTCYYMERFGNIWNITDSPDHEWPSSFMYMTPPDANQGMYASRLLVHCIMNYDAVKRWSDSTVGKRGEKYLEWKRNCTEKIVAKLGHIFPDFKNKVNAIYSASPLTIRDYFHTKDGSMFGYRKDCDNLYLTQLPVYTKVRNLLLTGQNVNLHGICGVPLTAILTAEALLGNDYLINEIAQIQ